MTKLLDQALESARSLPSEAQDDIASIVMQLVGDETSTLVALSAEERAAVETSKVAARRGAFASDEQVSAVWAKYGL